MTISSETSLSVKTSGKSGVGALLATLADRDAGKTLQSVADQGVVSAASFATSVLVGRHGSPGDLGVYFLLLNLALMARGIQEQLIGAPYVVLAARRQGTALARLTGSLLIQGTCFMLICIVLFGCFLTMPIRGSGTIAADTAVVLVLLTTPGLLARELIRQLAFARLQLTSVLVMDVAAMLLQLGGLAWFSHRQALSPANGLIAVGGAAAVAGLGWCLFMRPPLLLERAALVADWRANWALGRWMLASHALNTIVPQLIPWLLLLAHGKASAGTLAAAISVVGLSNVLAAGIGNFLSPRSAGAFARGGVPELRRVLGEAAWLYAVSMGFLTLLAWLAGGWFIKLIYGQMYADSGPVVAILMTAALVNSFGIVAGNGLWAIDRRRANFTADCGNAAMALLAAVALLPSWGPLGAAAAMLAGSALGTTIRCRRLWRELTECNRVGGQGPTAKGVLAP